MTLTPTERYNLIRRAQASIADPVNRFDMTWWDACIAGHICKLAALDGLVVPFGYTVAGWATHLLGLSEEQMVATFYTYGNDWGDRKVAIAKLEGLLEGRAASPALEPAGSALEPRAQRASARAEEQKELVGA